MNRVWLGILLLLGSLVSASAQQLLPIVVSSCGTPPTTYTAGRSYQPTMDTTGTLCTVSGGGSSGGTSSNFGSPFPTAGTAIGLSNGTNMVALTLGQATMPNSIPVAIASNQSAVPVAGSGSAGTAASGVVTVQGITSMTPLLVNPGTIATWGIGTAGTPSTNVMTVQGVGSGTTIPVTAGASSNIIGNVRIDQTTPGTTNAVQANAGTNLNTSLLALESGGNLATVAGAVSSSVMQANTKQVNGATTLTGAGATGTGSQRVTAAQDTTTIAGSAPGTAGSASANVVTVQGVSSMTPILANPGTAANWGVQTQGSTTSGQSGNLIQGAVTTSAPSYTTAQTSALSLDTSGNLRVSAIGGVGGFDADIATVPTVNNNSAYSASGSVGGLQTVSVFRNTSQPSGILNYLSISSKGGVTQAMTVYAFDTDPTSITCTNNSGFTMVAADIGKLVPGFPIVLTPAVAQGMTMTQASQPITTSVKNQDGTPTTNLYFCIVANGAMTTTTTTDITFKVGIAQD